MVKESFWEKVREILSKPEATPKELLEIIRALKIFHDTGFKTYSRDSWNSCVDESKHVNCDTFTCRPIFKQYLEYEKRLIDLGGIVEASGKEADEIREKMDGIWLILEENEMDWVDARAMSRGQK